MIHSKGSISELNVWSDGGSACLDSSVKNNCYDGYKFKVTWCYITIVAEEYTQNRESIEKDVSLLFFGCVALHIDEKYGE